MKIHTTKSNGRIYFYAWLKEDPRSYGKLKSGVGTYIEYNSWDKNWSVYRMSVHTYGKGIDFGSGWNLYQGLSKVEAIKAAKQALTILVKQRGRK